MGHSLLSEESRCLALAPTEGSALPALEQRMEEERAVGGGCSGDVQGGGLISLAAPLQKQVGDSCSPGGRWAGRACRGAAVI